MVPPPSTSNSLNACLSSATYNAVWWPCDYIREICRSTCSSDILSAISRPPAPSTTAAGTMLEHPQPVAVCNFAVQLTAKMSQHIRASDVPGGSSQQCMAALSAVQQSPDGASRHTGGRRGCRNIGQDYRCAGSSARPPCFGSDFPLFLSKAKMQSSHQSSGRSLQ